MKFRHTTSSGSERVEMQMTPMIDIVFQLIAFFVMSFRIAHSEGDFNVKLPAVTIGSGDEAPTDQPLLLHVKLVADDEGGLAEILLDDTAIDGMHELNEVVIDSVDQGGPAAADGPEVELECDPNLNYEHIIAAITAVTGYTTDSGDVVRLIEKIRFTPPE